MVDCCKGEKYGNGLHIDSGEAFDELGDRVDQEATFDDCGKVEEEFVTRDDGILLVVRMVCLHPESQRLIIGSNVTSSSLRAL